MENKINKFQDLAELDARIPPNMMMKYQGKDYVLKAGLEFKASQVFGIGKYGIDMEIVEKSVDKIIIKAILTTPSGMKFVNFGECNKLNTPPTMAKYALHLAATRAECRVLRSATACGYVAWEEMETSDQIKEIPVGEHDSELATEAQRKTLMGLGAGELKDNLTQAEAKAQIAELSVKK